MFRFTTAAQAFIDSGAEFALGHHYGTFQLTDEAIDAPLMALADALAKTGIPAERFRALRPGEVYGSSDSGFSWDNSVEPNILVLAAMLLHEYKRQHLNVLYLVTLYNRLRRATGVAGTPHTVIFEGKAASVKWRLPAVLAIPEISVHRTECRPPAAVWF